MNLDNVIKMKKEGKELSPVGKLQFAVTLIQEVMMLPFWTDDDSEKLIRLQYELWLFASAGSNENPS